MEKIEELKNFIENKYNIKLKNIEKSEESTDQNVYFLYCEKEKYVAKIYKNIEHTKSMILIHNYLSNCGLYVPKIIQNNNENEYCKLNDKEYIRKVIDSGNIIEFQAMNVYYPPLRFTRDELKNKNFKLIGKVIKVENKSAFK